MKKNLFVTGALSLLLLSGPVLAENTGMAGTYAYVPERSDNIGEAINTTVAASNFLIRPIARSRLGKTNMPYQKIILAFPNHQVSIVTDKRAPIVTTPDAKAIRWTREDGEVLDVSSGWRGQELEESFSADDGVRTNHFTLGADGKELRMKVTVTSNKLNKPLVYTLVYERR